MTGRLSGIYVHPIKSCRAVSCDTATVSAIGLQGDRIWQVVDVDGGAVTQREHRVLATVQPEPREDGGLRLSAPDRPTIEIGPPGTRSTTVTSLFGVPVAACDAGDEAAAWFTDLTGQAVRLAAMVSESGWRLPDDLDIFAEIADDPPWVHAPLPAERLQCAAPSVVSTSPAWKSPRAPLPTLANLCVTIG